MLAQKRRILLREPAHGADSFEGVEAVVFADVWLGTRGDGFRGEWGEDVGGGRADKVVDDGAQLTVERGFGVEHVLYYAREQAAADGT